ncbi:hypothetical protein HDV03_001748 [Kappamyces sp. JEL0829]|nr:hypothetical protein HDV03_001748 [Kappamyces sp. JEL0829]
MQASEIVQEIVETKTTQKLEASESAGEPVGVDEKPKAALPAHPELNIMESIKRPHENKRFSFYTFGRTKKTPTADASETRNAASMDAAPSRVPEIAEPSRKSFDVKKFLMKPQKNEAETAADKHQSTLAFKIANFRLPFGKTTNPKSENGDASEPVEEPAAPEPDAVASKRFSIKLPQLFQKSEKVVTFEDPATESVDNEQAEESAPGAKNRFSLPPAFNAAMAKFMKKSEIEDVSEPAGEAVVQTGEAETAEPVASAETPAVSEEAKAGPDEMSTLPRERKRFSFLPFGTAEKIQSPEGSDAPADDPKSAKKRFSFIPFKLPIKKAAEKTEPEAVAEPKAVAEPEAVARPPESAPADAKIETLEKVEAPAESKAEETKVEITEKAEETKVEVTEKTVPPAETKTQESHPEPAAEAVANKELPEIPAVETTDVSASSAPASEVVHTVTAAPTASEVVPAKETEPAPSHPEVQPAPVASPQ